MVTSLKLVMTGVKASGKTTTAELVKKLMPDIKIIIVGDYFADAFRHLYGEKAKRELTEEISRKIIIKLQKKIGNQIVGDTKGSKHVLIDTNLFLIKSTGFFPGLPEEFLKILNPDVIVMLEVNPESILERRLKDEKRKSDEITETGTHAKHRIRHAGKTIDEIEIEQEMQRIFALIYASLIGCSVKIINLKFKEREHFEHAKTASKEIVKILSTSYSVC